MGKFFTQVLLPILCNSGGHRGCEVTKGTGVSFQLTRPCKTGAPSGHSPPDSSSPPLSLGSLTLGGQTPGPPTPHRLSSLQKCYDHLTDTPYHSSPQAPDLGSSQPTISQ